MSKTIVLLSLLLATPALAAPKKVLTLAEAMGLADANVPALREARALMMVALAQSDEVRAPLLPQLNGTASYQRRTANYIPAPGALPSSISGSVTTTSSGASFNYFNFGLTLSQTLFDAPTYSRWRASMASYGSQKALADAARLDSALNARVAFFNARAARQLIDVAKELVANQKKHLDQVQGYIDVGARPEIDLAQARSDYANARVQLINSENNYGAGKATLNQAMGVEQDTEYDVEDASAEAVDVEDAPIDDQVTIAYKARPELVSVAEQQHAIELSLRAAWWGYAPTVGASTNVSSGGGDLTNLGWNWNFTVGLQWNLFGGLITYSQVKEMQAQLVNLKAQVDAVRLQVRLDVEKGRLAVRAAKATLGAANESLDNARIREKLAEGRYSAGVGNAIELSDAVLALANASGQKITAEFSLSNARSQLLRALGRR